jgi:hypothetical protein
MNQLKQIYNLKKDFKRIKMIQEASLDKNSYSGYKIENGLLFGSKEWFEAIDQGVIPKHTVKGIISRVYMSGHNDYPQFEIESDEGKTSWTRTGLDEAYKIGKSIELIYVEQKYKRPTAIIGPISKCVLEVNILE